MTNIILPQRALAKQQAETTQKQLVEQLKDANALQQARHGQADTASSSPAASDSAATPTAEIDTAQKVSIHDRETLLTYDKSGLEDLPDWVDHKS